MARCPKCKAMNRVGARFCSNCGYNLASTCPRCNTPLKPGAKFCAHCGASVYQTTPLPRDSDKAIVPNTVLESRYLVRKLLGMGGFGAVYLSEDLRLAGKECALKETFDTDGSAQRQFEQEANLLARLNHPRLVRVTDYFKAATGELFLVMEYVAGRDLGQVLEQTPGFLPEKQVVDWMIQVCDVLEYMHNWVDIQTGKPAPVIHRDIKPGNIKLCPDGKVMLIDLGIAKVKEPGSKTTRAARAYSPPYSPLEQYGEGTDERSDIYALGVTMYHLLTKQAPLAAPDLVYKKLTPPHQYNPEVSSAVEEVITRAMAGNPEHRFQTVRELRAALRAALENTASMQKLQVITPRSAKGLHEFRTLRGHIGAVRGVDFSKDGAVLASAGEDGTVKLWDPTNGREMGTLKGHTRRVESVVFSSDGKTLASGSGDKTVRLWRWYSGRLAHTLTGHNGAVFSVDFSHDGKILASGSGDGTIRLWDAASGQLIRALTERAHWVLNMVFRSAGVWTVAFSPGGAILASGGTDNIVRFWDVASGRIMHALNGHTGNVAMVAFNPNGTMLASGSWDTNVKLWRVASGKELRTLTSGVNIVRGLAFSPDGAMLASGNGKDIKLWGSTRRRLWELSGKRARRVLSGHKGDVLCVAFSPDGKIMASGSSDGTVRLWGAG